MSLEERALADRAAELRRAFDRSFAEAPGASAVSGEAFLAVGVNEDRYALRLAEISGLHVDKKITPLPSGSADLLGIAGFRGALVPIYDLRVLLGYPVGAMPRWIALVAPQTPVGLAFDTFDGYFSLAQSATPRADASGGQAHVTEALRFGDQVRSLVSVASIIESIKKRAQPSVPRKER